MTVATLLIMAALVFDTALIHGTQQQSNSVSHEQGRETDANMHQQQATSNKQHARMKCSRKIQQSM